MPQKLIILNFQLSPQLKENWISVKHQRQVLVLKVRIPLNL